MSTVKATNFQHPSSAAANITLGSDGSVVLPAGFTGGIGSNVVQTVKTDTGSESVASNNFGSDLLTTAITPTTTTSKVLVVATISMGTSGAEVLMSYRLMRGATAIFIGDTASNRPSVTGSHNIDLAGTVGTTTIMFLDSPATTSSTNYSVQLFNHSSITRTLYLNRSSTDSDDRLGARPVSSLTLIEVAA